MAWAMYVTSQSNRDARVITILSINVVP